MKIFFLFNTTPECYMQLPLGEVITGLDAFRHFIKDQMVAWLSLLCSSILR